MRVDAEVLAILARRRGFDGRTLSLAHRLLVDGVSATDVAFEFGVHRSRVYAVRRQVLEAARSLRLIDVARLPGSVARVADAMRVPAGHAGRGD